MTNDLTRYENTDDGFSDAAEEHAENLLRGELLKCSDGHWLVGQESARLARDKRLVSVGVGAAWVRWSNNRPTEYRVRRTGEHLPERSELGFTDETQWDKGPNNEPRDPWQNTRFCWFLDPATAAVYTFSTATWSGRDAVISLGDQVARMRVAKPGACPVVEFDSAPHKTKYGLKMKPVLRIVGWVTGADSQVDLKSIGKPAQVVEPKKVTKTKKASKVIEAETLDDLLNDEIPY